MNNYFISSNQLKDINRALRILEDLIESYSHNEFEHKNDSNILEVAYLTLDNVFDNQSIEGN
jgi:hypothetical protein